MAEDDCIPQLHCCAMRVGLLDTDGTPLTGGGNVYTTDLFQKITVTPVYQDGDEIQEKNACGATAIDYLGDPTFVRADVEVDLITPDPTLHSMLISGSSLLSPVSGGVGWQFPKVGIVTGDGVGVEFWTKRVTGGALSQVHPYAHWALPRVRSMRLGAREFSGTAQHAIISGQGNENANWDTGPGTDFDEDSTAVAQWIPADDFPVATCGDDNSPS